jgi:hypothetical protein
MAWERSASFAPSRLIAQNPSVPARRDNSDDPTVVLTPISESAAAAIRAGHPPADVRVAPGYPSEFSVGVAEHVGDPAQLGPFFIQRLEDELVVGEIGSALGDDGIVEIGYAVVEPLWGHGYASGAVKALVSRLREVPDIERVVAHTPLDRPASARVLEKAGFSFVGEVDDDEAGEPIRVRRWELRMA